MNPIFASLGHTKIGFMNGPKYITTAMERYAGFCGGMRGININIDEKYPYAVHSENTFQMQDGYDLAARLLTMEDPPTAIIAANSEMALGALQYCRRNGIRIPKDLLQEAYIVPKQSLGGVLSEEVCCIFQKELCSPCSRAHL
jgi:DNA-binding LacI/PurR family transcriptional regulator